MIAPINKSVRVLSPTGPTGASGTLEKVRILSVFTGPTGTFPVWNQINATQQAASPTGTFKSVIDASAIVGPHATLKTAIIPGYTGPA